MISVTTQQWHGWIAVWGWPFLRVLGLMLTEPLLSSRGVPTAARMGLAIFITLVLAPLLPAMPRVDPASAAGLLLAVQQLLIGLAIGFVMRIALTAAEMAGQLAGLQMGFGFAVFFDPRSPVETALVGRFMGLFALLIFMSINGYGLVITALAESFRVLPVSVDPLNPVGFGVVARFGGVIFGTGLVIALPVIAALLIANVAVGIMTRATPQLNLVAAGFPITLVTGLVALYLSVPFFGPRLVRLFEQAIDVAMGTAQALR